MAVGTSYTGVILDATAILDDMPSKAGCVRSTLPRGHALAWGGLELPSWLQLKPRPASVDASVVGSRVHEDDINMPWMYAEGLGLQQGTPHHDACICWFVRVPLGAWQHGHMAVPQPASCDLSGWGHHCTLPACAVSHSHLVWPGPFYALAYGKREPSTTACVSSCRLALPTLSMHAST